MTYRTPLNLPLLTYPTGIDIPIQELQQELSDLTWLQYSFGRAFVGEREVKGRIDYTYPAVYKGEANYQDASPNDNLISQSFFVVDGDYDFDNYEINTTNKFTAPVSLVIWGSLKKISNVFDEHFGSILLGSALNVINQNNSFKVNRVTDNSKDVFREFSVSDESTSLFYYPYFCYRIKMDVTASEECLPNINQLLSDYNITAP